MLSIEEIKELMKEMDASSISELKYETEDSKITLRKARPVTVTESAAPAPVAAQQAPAPVQPASGTADSVSDDHSDESADESSLYKITAPMVGTFYSSSSPDTEPYVQKGSKVDKNSVVCIVEAMKLFNEIEAEVKGTIVDVLAEDGQLVEFGQPLFLVKED